MGRELGTFPLAGEGWDGGANVAYQNSENIEHHKQNHDAPPARLRHRQRIPRRRCAGSLLVRQLQAESVSDQVEWIEDFQLQVEHVTDLRGRSAVLFVDAICPVKRHSIFSRISPFRQQLHQPCDDPVRAAAYLLRKCMEGMHRPASCCGVRGYGFELGRESERRGLGNLLHAEPQKSVSWLG